MVISLPPLAITKPAYKTYISKHHIIREELKEQKTSQDREDLLRFQPSNADKKPFQTNLHMELCTLSLGSGFPEAIPALTFFEYLRIKNTNNKQKLNVKLTRMA